MLECFQLESSFQVLRYTWEIVKLESFLQLKTFQLHDLSNYPFQLHVNPHFIKNGCIFIVMCAVRIEMRIYAGQIFSNKKLNFNLMIKYGVTLKI